MAQDFNGFYDGKQVFLTGGSGFIGTHLVHGLLSAGADVANLDRNPPHLAEQRSCWVEGDYLDVDAISSIVAERKPEIIFNLAAIADLNKGIEACSENVQGLQNLIQAASVANPPLQLIHFSTQLVVAAGYAPSSDEDFCPYTSYGESKAETEKVLRHSGDALRWTIVRPATIWGPYNYVFATGIWKYVWKRFYMLPSGSSEIRSYGYVTNLVEQVMRIPVVEPGLVDGQVFYIADGMMPGADWLDAFSIALTGRRVRRIPYSLLWLLAAGGSLSKAIGGPAPIDLGRFERITTDYPVPLDKTRAVLGIGSTSFEEGVASSVAWLRSLRPS